MNETATKILYVAAIISASMTTLLLAGAAWLIAKDVWTMLRKRKQPGDLIP